MLAVGGPATATAPPAAEGGSGVLAGGGAERAVGAGGGGGGVRGAGQPPRARAQALRPSDAPGSETTDADDAPDPETDAQAPGPPPPADDASELLALLVSFLESQGGSAPSSLLVAHFRDRVPPAGMPLFRQLLNQVARLQRSRAAGGQGAGGGGGGVWLLRQEFQ